MSCTPPQDNVKEPASELVEAFAESNEKEGLPTFVLSDSIISHLRKIPHYIQECHRARQYQLKHHDRLQEEFKEAKSHALSMRITRGQAKLECQRGQREMITSLEQREEMRQLSMEYYNAERAKKIVQQRIEQHEQYVQDAEMDHYEFLQSIQDMLLQKLDTAEKRGDQAPPATTTLPFLTPGRHHSQSRSGTRQFGEEAESAGSHRKSLGVAAELHYLEYYAPPQALHQPLVTRSFTYTGLPKDNVERMLQADLHLDNAKARLSNAHLELQNHRESYHYQVEGYAHEHHKNVEDVESEYGPLYLERTMRKTQAIDDAEEGVQDAKHLAKRLQIPVVDERESDPSCLPCEGWNRRDHQDAVRSVNRKRLAEWMEDTRDPKKTRVQVDRDEVVFPFSLRNIEGVDDSPSELNPDPYFKRNLVGWNRYCRDRVLQVENVKAKRRRSRSVHVLQAIPKPESDPGLASDRPAYTPLTEYDPKTNMNEGLKANADDSVVVITQAHPDSWPQRSVFSKHWSSIHDSGYAE